VECAADASEGGLRRGAHRALIRPASAALQWPAERFINLGLDEALHCMYGATGRVVAAARTSPLQTGTCGERWTPLHRVFVGLVASRVVRCGASAVFEVARRLGALPVRHCVFRVFF
jgi:hypothetical protein